MILLGNFQHQLSFLLVVGRLILAFGHPAQPPVVTVFAFELAGAGVEADDVADRVVEYGVVRSARLENRDPPLF
jgi:hypothetical protein